MDNEKSQIWPDSKKFALCLTHDVDRTKKSYQYITHFLKTRRPYHLISFFQRNNPYWNFDKIMEIENKYNVKSTYFFMNERKKIDLASISVRRYDIHEPRIKSIIQKLNNDGFEIGLHGSFRSYKDENMLANEKNGLEELLGNKIIGIRQHYLNLEIPITWQIQEKVGLSYDTTFGFHDEIGFRDGIYFPFYPFGDSSFLVIPLAIMDSLLFKHTENVEDAWRKCQELIDVVEEKGGVLTILWHQRVFNEYEYPQWAKIYENIIKKCKEKNAWIAPAGDIAKWWNENVEVKQ